ncbi:uncharacterized protein G2W53_010367 [Senna tora]|uniref:Retrotransposon gag domain-containing protein n=1 Tax=Senna tora TaxID=362788 RepID=A0A834WZR4_9FABA|nr:uncharacterized protein G2W53_010367 [Senna tora]
MKMEKIFEILEVIDYEKAILATFTFTDEAEHWWRNTKGVLKVRNVQLTWESFLAKFYEKYFPRHIQDEKETEFINLKQEDGDMSVDTYVAKFIQLSRYSSYLKKCDDEPWKTEKLERGFKPEIRDRMATLQIRVFYKPREEESSIENNKINGRGAWNKKGASHSFIPYDCVKRLGLTINVLPYDLSISTPTGKKIVTSDVCLNCIVQFNHCYTTIDLICMAFRDKGAEKYLRKGCQGFLVFFSVEVKVEDGIEEIPIVREFPEVFPTEVCGIRDRLHPVENGNNVLLPPASYALSLEEKLIVCTFVANLKVPDAFSSNISRYLRTLKSYVCNKVRPEGSIAEGYLAEECLTFCSRYLKNILTKFNKPPRNDDGLIPDCKIYVFKNTFQAKGRPEDLIMSHAELHQTRMYVLQNCEEVSPYMQKFKDNQALTSNETNYSDFPNWFQARVHKKSTDELISLAC